jgi:tetratricopeptide (TPR) repeat protein
MMMTRRVKPGVVGHRSVRVLTASLCCLAFVAHAELAALDAPVILSAGQVVPKNEAIQKAAQQVDEGDFEDAIRTLERGIEQPDLTDDQLAEMYRLLGLSHLYLGNEDRARDAFEKLLQARPDYELPKSAPPKIRSLYARIKEDIRKRRVRPVTLTVTPVTEASGAEAVVVEARIDDMALGAKAKLFYRRAGAQSFSSIDFARGKTSRADYTATVPAFEVPAEEQSYEVEYYVEVADAAQRRLAGRGDPYNPLTFRVAAKKLSTAPVVEATPLYKSPWLWIGIGLGAAAATTGIVVLATSNQTATLPVKIQIDGQP